MTKQLTPAPINFETKLDSFIEDMTLCDYIKKIENRLHTYTYWCYNCLCLLSYAIDDNWMRLEVVTGEHEDRLDAKGHLEQWMEPNDPMYIVQPDQSQTNTYRFYYSDGWEHLTPAPIDQKNVVSDFTDIFHNDECLVRTDMKTRHEYFIYRDCLCEVIWTYGYHRFVVHPLQGEPNLKELCKSDFKRIIDEMNGINKSQGLLVKTFGEGDYGFYFTPECNE